MAKKSVAGTALDPTIKFSTLTIDGQDYKLAYSFNSLALAEAAAGCNLMTGLQTMLDDGVSALQFRGLFYAALLVAQPQITIEEAAALIRFDTMPLINSAIGEAYILSMPKEKKSEPVENQNQ